MKVFISWSGELSKNIAELLSTWLVDVLQLTEAWLSKNDIDKGKIWFADISKELSETVVGILYLTRENKNRPWVLFEGRCTLQRAIEQLRMPLLGGSAEFRYRCAAVPV